MSNLSLIFLKDIIVRITEAWSGTQFEILNYLWFMNRIWKSCNSIKIFYLTINQVKETLYEHFWGLHWAFQLLHWRIYVQRTIFKLIVSRVSHCTNWNLTSFVFVDLQLTYRFEISCKYVVSKKLSKLWICYISIMFPTVI